MTTLELQNAVFIQNDQIKTDSLKVAEVFGKRHSDIIRAIKILIVQLSLANAILRRLII